MRRLRAAAVLIALVVGWALCAAVAPSVATAEGRTVKATVVRSPDQNGGRPDDLGQIAARTLGDPNRAAEIFRLNQGRPQSDGSALQQPDEPLHPGWLLQLPDDAAGPDVQQATMSDGSGSGPAPPATTHGRKHVTWKTLLAVIAGGVVLLVTTVAILFRRRLAAAGAWVGRAVGITGAMERSRIRALRRDRIMAAQAWQRDGATALAARAALGDAARLIRPGAPLPVAVDVSPTLARVHGVTDAPGAEAGAGVTSWQRDADATWARPTSELPAPAASSCRPVRVGGEVGHQTFLDLAQCGGLLAVGGEPRSAAALVDSVIGQVLSSYPDVEVVPMRPDGAVPPPAPAGSVSPLRAGAVAGPLRRVLVLPQGAPPEMVQAVAAGNDRTGGTVVVFAGDAPQAHWRLVTGRDGTVDVPLLARTLTAAC